MSDSTHTALNEFAIDLAAAQHERRSTTAGRLRLIEDAMVGVVAFRDRHSNPDRYCACDDRQRCYLHGVTIPQAIRAAEALLAELVAAREEQP